MANEISITSRLSATKDGTSVANATSAFTIDMTGTPMYQANPLITTAGALSVSPVDQGATDILDRYWLFIRNTESAHEVHVSLDGGSTYDFVVLPGESFGPVLVRHGRTLWAKAIVPAASPAEGTTIGSAVCEVIAVQS